MFTRCLDKLRQCATKSYFTVVLCVLPPSVLAIFVARYTVDIPYWDQWQFVPLLDKLYRGVLTFNDIRTQLPMEQHILLLPKLIMLSFASLTRWNTQYELLANLILGLIIFLTFLRLVASTSVALGSYSLLRLSPVFSIMVFSLSQWENWSWGWQISYFLNVAAALLGFTFLCTKNCSWYRLGTSIVLGVVATFSLNQGLLYWFLGLGMLWALRTDPRKAIYYIVAWSSASAAIIAVFLMWYRSPVTAAHSVSTIFTSAYFKYICVDLGSPLLGFSSQPYFIHIAMAIGGCGICLFFVLCGLVVKSRHIRRHLFIPYLASALYALGAALLTGMGRADLGLVQASSSRYITISNLFWLSNIVMVYLFMRADISTSLVVPWKKGWRLISLCSLGILLCCLCLNWARGGRAFLWRYRDMSMARSCILSGSKDLRPLRKIFPKESIVISNAEILQQHRLSLFRQK